MIYVKCSDSESEVPGLLQFLQEEKLQPGKRAACGTAATQAVGPKNACARFILF